LKDGRAVHRWVEENGIRIAAVTFADEAKLHFNFRNNFFDPGVTIASLNDMELVTGKFVPTLAYTAFQMIRNGLLNTATATATGFRNHEVPVLMFVLSDGETLLPQKL
jgi:hypothetical protein